MRIPQDAEKHQSLIDELVEILIKEGCSITEAEGRKEFQNPRALTNDGYGDQADKSPDIYAYDPLRRCYVLGEAKTGRSDFESEHSLTQYNVFLDQVDRRTGNPFRLYVIIPSSKVPEFNTLITHYIHREYWHKMILVSSSRWVE
jgi:hypothetical protein